MLSLTCKQVYYSNETSPVSVIADDVLCARAESWRRHNEHVLRDERRRRRLARLRLLMFWRRG